jgi:hypothetical protein
MDKDAHELYKNRSSDNAMDWVKNLLIVEYGVITKVFDANTVRAQLMVRRDFAPKSFIVRILRVDATALVETVVMPQVNDQVLLLFFRSYDDFMLQNPAALAADNDAEDPTIVTNNAARYNAFSGVGILARTARGTVPTTVAHYSDADVGPVMDFQSNAVFMAALRNAVSIVFDSQAGAAGSTQVSKPVNVTLGKKSPLNFEQRGNVVALAADDATTELDFGKNATLTINLGDGALITIDSDDGKSEHYAKEVSITSDKELTLTGVGVTIDAKGNKISLKNNSANMKSALDSTLTDCSSLVTALKTFSGVAAQSAITTGGSSAPSLAAAIVALMGVLTTALNALGFTADKTTIDNLLK